MPACAQVVLVLDAHDRRDLAGLSELGHGDIGDTQVMDQAFLAQREQGLQRFGQWGRAAVVAAQPQVHHVKAVHAEGAQVGLDAAAQPVGSEPGQLRRGEGEVGPPPWWR